MWHSEHATTSQLTPHFETIPQPQGRASTKKSKAGKKQQHARRYRNTPPPHSFVGSSFAALIDCCYLLRLEKGKPLNRIVLEAVHTAAGAADSHSGAPPHRLTFYIFPSKAGHVCQGGCPQLPQRRSSTLQSPSKKTLLRLWISLPSPSAAPLCHVRVVCPCVFIHCLSLTAPPSPAAPPVCGRTFKSSYTCSRCSAHYCGRTCLHVHQEERCLKFL